MKYIEKHFDTDIVRQHKKELQDKQLDKDSLLQRKESGENLRVKELFEQVKSRDILPHVEDLRKQMIEEQGGICCYCGCILRENWKSIEHVKPKSKYIELVGEYENLLYSCRPSEKEESDVKQRVEKQKRPDYFHCDKHKDNEEIPITPLDKSCEQQFIYKLDGTVKAANGSKEAEKTISILNLNLDTLVKQRRTAINTILFAEEDSDWEKISQTIMNRTDGIYREFCFVIKNVMDNMRSYLENERDKMKLK